MVPFGLLQRHQMMTRAKDKAKEDKRLFAQKTNYVFLFYLKSVYMSLKTIKWAHGWTI